MSRQGPTTLENALDLLAKHGYPDRLYVHPLDYREMAQLMARDTFGQDADGWYFTLLSTQVRPRGHIGSVDISKTRQL